MFNRQNQHVIYYVHNNSKKQLGLSAQTMKSRDDINNKIVELGNKFYMVKSFFEKYNFKRDNLYDFGQSLIKQYKGKKPNLRLQSKTKRMKEAIYCWYAENFFEEMFIHNPDIITSLFSIYKNPKQDNQTKDSKHDNTTKTLQKHQNQMIAKENKNQSKTKKIQPQAHDAETKERKNKNIIPTIFQKNETVEPSMLQTNEDTEPSKQQKNEDINYFLDSNCYNFSDIFDWVF